MIFNSALTIDSETKAYEAPHDHKNELRLWLRLLTCTTRVESEIRKRLRERFNTTLPRFDLLAQLERAPDGMTLGELSKRMMVSNGNITGLVDRLVASGLVHRTPLPTDRRVQIVKLTKAGRGDFRRMAREHEDWIAQMFSGLDAKDVTALLEGLSRLKTSVMTAGVPEADQ